MEQSNPVYKLRMICVDLRELPVHPMPQGWSSRPYQQGDEVHWVRIQAAADKENAISLGLFFKQFGADARILSQRQIYISNNRSAPSATATAWFADVQHAGSMGRLHWVAVHPDYQGGGLARPLICAACQRLRDLGHTAAWLSTSSSRSRAIRLYFEFGFKPWIQSVADEQNWERYLASDPAGGV